MTLTNHLERCVWTTSLRKHCWSCSFFSYAPWIKLIEEVVGIAEFEALVEEPETDTYRPRIEEKLELAMRVTNGCSDGRS